MVFLKKDKGSKTKIVIEIANQLSRSTNGRITALAQAPPLIKRTTKKVRAAMKAKPISKPPIPLRRPFILLRWEKRS